MNEHKAAPSDQSESSTRPESGLNVLIRSPFLIPSRTSQIYSQFHKYIDHTALLLAYDMVLYS